MYMDFCDSVILWYPLLPYFSLCLTGEFVSYWSPSNSIVLFCPGKNYLKRMNCLPGNLSLLLSKMTTIYPNENVCYYLSNTQRNGFWGFPFQPNLSLNITYYHSLPCPSLTSLLIIYMDFNKWIMAVHVSSSFYSLKFQPEGQNLPV